MRRAAVASIAVVLGTLALVVVPLALGPDDRVAHAAALVPFGGCEQLREHLVEQGVRQVGPYGLEGGSRLFAADQTTARMEGAAATPAQGEGGPGVSPDFSVTNVQEEGVDEPDVVKTDGSTVYALVNGSIRSADVTRDEPVELDSIELRMEGSSIPAEELLLAGDTLFAFGSIYEDTPVSHMEGDSFEGDAVEGDATAPKLQQPEEPAEVEPGIVRIPTPAAPQRAAVFEIDVSDPEDLRVVGSMALEGDRVAARLSGGLVRLVLRSQMPRSLPFVSPDFSEIVEPLAEDGPAYRNPSSEEVEQRNARATELNREVVNRSRIEDWLPRYQLSEGSSGRLDGDERALVDCERVNRLPEPSGLGLVSVVTIDPRGDLDAGEPSSVVGDAQIAYASAESLYLAATHWGAVVGGPGSDVIFRGDVAVPDVGVPNDVWTSVHRFDLSEPGEADYRSSGRVEGSVRDQWAFSEHKGDLRVTATSGLGEPETSVVVLRESGDRLEQVGSVRGLGRGEQVYAVRYVGDIGFVVTFRQVDPLHVIDLSDPSVPRVAGELEMPGYSAYLHPVGEGRLLGVGVDATGEGQRIGAQVSLFDVTDLSHPRRVAHLPLRSSFLALEQEGHHAFLYWGPTRLVVLPIEVSYTEGQEPVQGFLGAVLFEVGVDGTTLEEAGRIEHPLLFPLSGWPGVRRAMVRGDRLLTVSGAGLMSTPLDDPSKSGRFLAWHIPDPEVIPEVEPGG